MKKKPEHIERIGLIANLDKGSSRQAVKQAAELITRADRQIASSAAIAHIAGHGCQTFDSPAILARETDLLLVFGGDGTILQVARDIDGARTPILGINVGHLGFLTAVSIEDFPQALQKVWDGDYFIEPRSMIQAAGKCQDRPVVTAALNDIVISHGAVSRLIELQVSVDNEPLTCYRGDGLIISSPTGSTAYSLSAGGPIITPDANVLVITPICPHTLTNRSVVISAKSTIEIKLVSEKVDTIVSADGQVQSPLAAGESITVRRSRRFINMLHPSGSSFFETVRRKLQWRGSYV